MTNLSEIRYVTLVGSGGPDRQRDWQALWLRKGSDPTRVTSRRGQRLYQVVSKFMEK